MQEPGTGSSWAAELTSGLRPWRERLGALPSSAVIVLVGLLAGAVVAAVTATLVRGSPVGADAAALPMAVRITTTTAPPPPATVHVAGAVAQPGVVELPEGARVVDALTAAGGARPDADLARLNLAEQVVDGSRIYVPAIGEQPPPALAPVGAGGAPATGGGPAPGAPLDLNRATADQLDELPGVGPATAAAIVAHRDSHGPFGAVDDLLSVRGIGPAKLDAIRPLVTV